MKKEIIKWEIGDISYSGHRMMDSMVLEVYYDDANVDEKLSSYLTKLEKRAVEITGVDFSKWFYDYENNLIPEEDVKNLEKFGIVFNPYNWDEPACEDGYSDYIVFATEDYFDIWVQLVKLADPSIRIDIMAIQTHTPLSDGYGIFRSV